MAPLAERVVIAVHPRRAAFRRPAELYFSVYVETVGPGDRFDRDTTLCPSRPWHFERRLARMCRWFACRPLWNWMSRYHLS